MRYDQSPLPLPDRTSLVSSRAASMRVEAIAVVWAAPAADVQQQHDDDVSLWRADCDLVKRALCTASSIAEAVNSRECEADMPIVGQHPCP